MFSLKKSGLITTFILITLAINLLVQNVTLTESTREFRDDFNILGHVRSAHHIEKVIQVDMVPGKLSFPPAAILFFT